MFRVTFYSYKGGVGRTRALLQVARILAEANRRVVVVELDLEAPELGRTRATKMPNGDQRRPGVSDLILGWRSGASPALKDCLYPAPDSRFGDRLLFLGAGTRGLELAAAIPALYENLDSDDAQLFQLLLAEIEESVHPDYVLFDSRTGLTGVSGVSTIELPQLLVMLTSLAEASVNGTERVLRELDQHDGWEPRAATLVVLSPVPREDDLGGKSQPGPGLKPTPTPSPLLRRLQGATAQLRPLVNRHLNAVAHRFSRLTVHMLMPELEYDPWLPLTGELGRPRSTTLDTQYRHLAHLVTLANPDERTPLPSAALSARMTAMGTLAPRLTVTGTLIDD